MEKVLRRNFLITLGAFLSTDGARIGHGKPNLSQPLFASCFRRTNGSFGVLIFNEFGQRFFEFSLPDRGHAVAINAQRGQGVVFARRPGNFGLVFSLNGQVEPRIFTTPNDRHFYGHGVFSQNGKLLYAAENDFANATGIIGIYDATDNFRRIGEFSSHGIGPHEILLHPNAKMLIIANGGIETHPEFGRAKLNISTMKPSLAFLDAQSGDLIEKHELDADHHKLSIRHMDVTHGGDIVFGCQNQGPRTDLFPLVGSVRLGHDMKLWDIETAELAKFANYVGSVSIDANGETAAITLPKGDHIAIFSLKEKQLLRTASLRRCAGVAHGSRQFITTLESGALADLNTGKSVEFPSMEFDNHLSSFELF